jgi:DNA polymerase III subunit epsilon
MIRLLVLDSETGGLDPTTDALLSVGLVDWADGRVTRQQEILIDPEGLRCDPQALAVNKIDLDVHCAYSVPRSYAAKQIQDFCAPMGRPVIAGHNAQFDIGFVRRLFTPETLRRTFSHRVLDTLQLLLFLEHAGLIPPGIGKLDQAMAHFGLTMPEGKRHTALGDALVTAELYSRLLKLIAGVPV